MIRTAEEHADAANPSNLDPSRLLVAVGRDPATVTAGCGDAVAYDCTYPIRGRLDHNGIDDSCCHVDPCPGHCLNDPCPDDDSSDAGTDAATSEGGPSACSGACVTLPPLGGWEGPILLSLSSEGTETECPAQAPVIGYQGHEGLNVPSASCGTCSCSAPSGSCAPPLTFTASSKSCNIPGAVTSPSMAPPRGTDPALRTTASARTLLCSGAERPISHHRAAGHDGAGLHAFNPGPHNLSTPSWTTAVLACRGMATSGFGCSDPGQTCVPSRCHRISRCAFTTKRM